MALENQWVTYLYRSYKSIKASILDRMKTLVPEITDHSDSNIMVIILDSFSGLVEQLNYYVDSVARESFIPTARRYSSVLKLTRLIDYRVRAKIGSLVDLKITAVDVSENPVILDHDETLAIGLIVKDDIGTEFITQSAITIFTGSSSVVIGATQSKLTVDESIGTTTSSPNQIYELNDDYREGTLQITINGQTWVLVDTFAFSGPEDKHFIVEVDQNKQSWVLFGDNLKGLIPPNGYSILATYHTCKGLIGNVEANTITTWDSAPTPPTNTPTIDHYIVTNPLPAVGGQDEQGLEEIRKLSTLSLRTLDRAVTSQDHNDICLLVPGVGKAYAEFIAIEKKILFYVAPNEGGTAPSQLLTDVINYFETRKMISTVVTAIAAGETKLRLTIIATVKFRRNTTQAETDIKEALQDTLGFNNSEVNKKIRTSDIIALIDNLDKIDHLTLPDFTTKPYPRISKGSNPLESNWRIEIQPENTTNNQWRVYVSATNTARLYKNDGTGEDFDGEITIHASDPSSTDYTSKSGELKMSMWGTFLVGDEWTFNTYPYNEDHIFTDNTIPIYNESELTLTVNEQLGL